MKNRMISAAALVVALLALAFMPAPGGSQNPPQTTGAQSKDNVVYVCACLGNKVLLLHDRSQDGRALRLRHFRRPTAEGSAAR